MKMLSELIFQHRSFGLIAAALLGAAALPGLGAIASAETPEGYHKLWSDPALTQRIEKNIERYRKQDAALEIVSADGKPLAGATVEAQQKTHRFLFGCNGFVLGQLDTPEKNQRYEEAFAKIFNFVTVPFYWEGTEPTQGELRYAEGSRDIWRRPPPDRYLPFAKKYGITLKGHPLLWHAYNPPWLPKDADTLRKLYQKRFAEIASRYAKDIPIWDVVNESLVCPKTYPLFTDDRSYVAWAFKEAHRVFRPENTLMINEVTGCHLWGAGAENRYYKQVKQLQAGGADVKGIGFQFHFFSADALKKYLNDAQYAPAKLLDLYESFGDFNLPLYVTEITIATPAGEPNVQAEVAGNLYRLWFSAPKMAGITWWNLGDGTAVKGENTALGGLLDNSFAPKASYLALERLINQEWKTRLTTKADEQGRVRFRGFCGKYSVKVAAGGAEQEFAVELAPGAAAQQKLVFGKQ
ncbi:MAG: endo-1,4-beta-xylanase [Candidatus Sumerlaeota bacterium]|nr:endo-1,4-beta-xylanase [Candidatus Sumerlaeota bacterium]